MIYLKQKNNGVDIKNFIWYARVSEQKRSFEINFDGTINAIPTDETCDIRVNSGSVEVHNNEIWSNQFIFNPRRKLEYSLSSWAANLKYFGYRVIGENAVTNKQYIMPKNKSFNKRFVVGAGNEGYIEVVGKNLVKTLFAEPADKHNDEYRAHNLSLKKIIPKGDHSWLPQIFGAVGQRIVYNNNVYPIDRKLTLEDFKEMYIDMLKDGYTIKDIKLSNLAFRGNKLIFNDIGKSLSVFQKGDKKNIEWTRSIIRASFYIVEHQFDANMLKKKSTSYESYELINNPKFQIFQNEIFKKAGIQIQKKKGLSSKIIKELHKVIYIKRQYKDKGPAHVGAVIFDRNDNVVISARNAPWPEGVKPIKRVDHAEAIALQKLQRGKYENLSIVITKSPCKEYCRKLLMRYFKKYSAIKNIFLILSQPLSDDIVEYDGVNVFLVDREKLDKDSRKLVDEMTRRFDKHLNKKRRR